MEEISSDGAVGAPAPALRRFVGAYRGYHVMGPPALHRGLPSRNLTFILSLDDPVDIVRMPGELQPPGTYQAFVGGLHVEAARIRHGGRQVGISVQLTPFGARALLGVPARELANRVVGLDELFGPGAIRLVDRLASVPDWHRRFRVLDVALLGRLQDPRDPPREVAWAWRRLLATGGTTAVGALAAEVGYSRRHFTHLFHRELGLSPKVAARVLRFERSRRLLERAAPAGLATIAAESGYHDQAHLTREWRALAGCTPTTWIAEELPFVQDGHEVDG